MPKKNSKTHPASPDAELMPSPNESLGEYLRRLRLIRGLNLGDVSGQTPQVPESEHVSYPYLSQLELGRARHPSRERLVSLARVFGIPEAWMLEKAGYSSGQTALADELDPQSRNIALRAAQLSAEERSLVDSVIDGLLRRRRQSK